MLYWLRWNEETSYDFSVLRNAQKAVKVKKDYLNWSKIL